MSQVQSTRFAGEVAIVTGAAPVPSIGHTTAARLASEGANVVITDIDGDRLEASAADLAPMGEVVPHVADLTDEGQVARLVEATIDRFGRVDSLVNLAALQPPFIPLEETPLDHWHRVLAASLDTSFLPCRAVIPHMRAAGYGRIVNTTSGVTEIGLAGLGPYVTAKAGVIGFTRVLAREVGDGGITVNAIMPGLTATKHTLTMLEEAAADEHFDEHVSQQCVPRRGTPDDISDAISFLVSRDAGFVTGQILNATGGLCFT